MKLPNISVVVFYAFKDRIWHKKFGSDSPSHLQLSTLNKAKQNKIKSIMNLKNRPILGILSLRNTVRSPFLSTDLFLVKDLLSPLHYKSLPVLRLAMS